MAGFGHAVSILEESWAIRWASPNWWNASVI